jgi:hypothetical protein
VAVSGSQCCVLGLQDGLVRYTHCTILAGCGAWLQGQFCPSAGVWLVQVENFFLTVHSMSAHQVARLTIIGTEELPVRGVGVWATGWLSC